MQKDGPKEGEVVEEKDVKVILNDDTIVDTATPEDNVKLKNDEIYALWEKNMHDFVPEDLTNFVIDASRQILFENQRMKLGTPNNKKLSSVSNISVFFANICFRNSSSTPNICFL